LKGPIQSVEVSYFVHATEDPQKIAAAVESVFGFVGAPATEELEGHFGNAILTVNHHLTGEDAGSAFASLASKMDSD